ncbi:MAG: methylenetetrahydrofolate reductase [Cyanobacteria bacterium P01_F01_bin.116]
MKFSIEVTPKADVSQLPSTVKEVSITFLPNADYRDVVSQAKRLRESGFEPIPHVPARNIRTQQDLSDFINMLREQADIRQVLLIGGSLKTSAGPYASTMSLLETGLFDGLRIGVAGHPEAMPQLCHRECDRTLMLKNEYARTTGTDMFIVSQWSLNAATITTWLDRIKPFNALPIYLGIPGPTTPKSLLKFASICGVKTSLLGLQQPARLGQLLTIQTPDDLVDALHHRIEHFHIYTFGGLKHTRDWLAKRPLQQLLSL